jgi:hypothetical protein
MKKSLLILLLFVVFGCTKDLIDDYEINAEVPESLKIIEPIGLKLESTFVTNKVSINAKFDKIGTYRIKIIDISGKVVSSEKIFADQGDNLLNVYTTALDKSSYQVHILDEFNNVLGIESFVMIN